MSTVTFWLHGGTCFGTLTYQQKEGNDETQNEIVAAPAIFGDMSVDYPEHSAERINRTYTLTDDLPDAPQLMIEIRDLEGGILIIRLNDSNSEQTKEFQITENGPFLLCLQADELMHTWTPKSKNSSRFSVFYRLTSFDVSLPECFIEPTRPVEEIEETRESFKLFYIFIPIAIVVFLSQLIFYTYQLCNEKQGSQIEYIRSVDPWEIDSLQLTISNRIGRGEALLIQSNVRKGRCQKAGHSTGCTFQIATNVIFVEDLYRIAWEVASALEFLASKNVLHRDVAARNILLTSQKTSKLSDFGLSRSSNKALYTSHGGCLPIKWTALEAIEFGIFTEKADVWSFGVLLWEMFSFGDTPYEDLEPSRLLGELKKGFRLVPPHRTPTQISEVMTSCWKTRLTNRPTFQTITQKLSSFNESQLLTKGC
ncbi:unnamed protein product, partial [Mesorhabditis belari]|uniref:receptor protein-tyrosine kinase n=1 Tax=Mesorhabditis belari TaxID=2138241 RepID=A0AAF3J6A7_9BILA